MTIFKHDFFKIFSEVVILLPALLAILTAAMTWNWKPLQVIQHIHKPHIIFIHSFQTAINRGIGQFYKI